MADVTRGSLVLAIKSLRFVVDRSAMRGLEFMHLLPPGRCGFAEITIFDVTENLTKGLEAAKGWLEVAEQYGAGIEEQRHGIADCLLHIDAKIEVIAMLKLLGGNALEFYGDELPVFVSAERYLDRALMLQEMDSGERRNKAKPKGGWKRNR